MMVKLRTRGLHPAESTRDALAARLHKDWAEIADRVEALNARKDEEFNHLLSKARDAREGGEGAWTTLSRGEKLAVALALNRFDWLTRLHYTIPEAIERVGPEWVDMIPAVAKIIQDGK